MHADLVFCDKDNSYTGKYLTWACLQFQRLRPLSLWQRAWCHAGRHVAREEAGSFNSDPQIAGRERETVTGVAGSLGPSAPKS